MPFLDIDHVRRIGYAGYDGLIELARNLDRAVHSPVWAQVRSRPHWASRAWRARRWPEGDAMAEIVHSDQAARASIR